MTGCNLHNNLKRTLEIKLMDQFGKFGLLAPQPLLLLPCMTDSICPAPAGVWLEQRVVSTPSDSFLARSAGPCATPLLRG